MKSIIWGIALSLLAPSITVLAQDPSKPSGLDYYVGDKAHEKNDKAIKWVNSIAVTDPAYGSDIKGDTTVNFTGGNLTHFKVMCWQQPTTENPAPTGHDQVVADDVKPDVSGAMSFVFPADKFPNGPVTVRIYGKDEGDTQDLCELQLYNKGGVKFNQGIPKSDPAGAAGMTLAFSDDFDGPLSITHDGVGAKYEGHKTGGGDFSGYPFTSAEQAMNPFVQADGFLKIHASKNSSGESSSGIISSLHEDGTGFIAHAPCYFECRFIAQSAPGTWPAFWLLSDGGFSKDPAVKALGSDEFDAIEAYGGKGPGNPNFANYAATSHYWGEKDANGQAIDGSHDHTDVPMMELGNRSSWSTTFHTYGIQILPDKITYYFDDMPVFSHPNRGLAQKQGLWFLVNYAIGGISGWKIHLDRYNNQTDMYVDYVRVYQGK